MRSAAWSSVTPGLLLDRHAFGHDHAVVRGDDAQAVDHGVHRRAGVAAGRPWPRASTRSACALDERRQPVLVDRRPHAEGDRLAQRAVQRRQRAGQRAVAGRGGDARCSARSLSMKASRSSPAARISADELAQPHDVVVGAPVRRADGRRVLDARRAPRWPRSAPRGPSARRPRRGSAARLGLVGDERALAGARAHEASGRQQRERLTGHRGGHAEARGEVALVG